MNKQQSTSSKEQGSYKAVIVCGILIAACVACFGIAFTHFKINEQRSDQIWTSSDTGYDEKVEQQKAAEEEVQNNRKDVIEK